MKIAGLMTVILGLFSGVAAAQDCSSRLALAGLTSEAAQVSGNSDTWRNILARVVAEVESLDLEQGDSATTLTWNVTPYVEAKAVVWKEPSLFEPLSNALSSDELRHDFGDKIREGDDWEVSVAGHWGQKEKNGLRGGFAGYYSSLAKRAKVGIGSTFLGSPVSCEQVLNIVPQEVIEAMGRQMQDPKNPPRELSFRGFARQRRDLVGPDKWGLTLKFNYGISPANSAALDVEDRVSIALIPYLDEVAVGLRAADQQLKQAPRPATQAARDAKTAAERRERLRQLGDDSTSPGLKRQLAFEAEWQHTDNYDSPESTGPILALPEEESLVIKASYSLQFSRDKVDQPAAPLYEFSASYEDVDGDAQRQSRFLASAKAVMRVSALGKDSDLTFGLHYANKPEYLVLGNDDHALSARLALTFKMGKPQVPGL